MPSTIQKANIHLDFLDGLRGAAALYVVLFHAIPQLPEAFNALSPIEKLICGILGYGHYAVTIFIMLSGFCLMIPIARGHELGGTFNFFYKRAKRILPPYYFAILLCILLISTIIGQKTGTRWDHGFPFTINDVVLHLALLHDLYVDTGGKISHTFWSIAVEWRIYFLFPIIFVAWKRIGAYPVLIICTIFSYLGQYLLAWTDFNKAEWGVCVHYISMFVFGMLACDLALGENQRKTIDQHTLKQFTLLGFILSIVVMCLCPDWPFYIHDFFLALWFCPFLVYISKNPSSWGNRAFSCKPLTILGAFSYSLYLTHAPVLQIVTQYVVRPLALAPLPSAILMLFLSAIICSIAGYLFYLCFERPFLRKPTLT